MRIGSAPFVSDGITEGGLAWVPGCGLGRVLDLSGDLAAVDVPGLDRVVYALRRVLIPGEVAAAVAPAFLSQAWGQA